MRRNTPDVPEGEDVPLVSYSRMSTDLQDLSPAVQMEQITDFCIRNRLKVIKGFDDEGISGAYGEEKRPGLAAMMQYLRKHGSDPERPVQGVIVWNTDRLFRNQEEWHKFAKMIRGYGYDLYSVMQGRMDLQSATGYMVAGMMSEFAAYERELIGQRIRDHNMHVLQSGRFPGGAYPIGYSYNPETKTLGMDEERAPIALKVFSYYISCGGSGTAVARKLNMEGIPSPRGGHWSGVGVYATLRCSIYRQILQYGGEKVHAPDYIPRIIPESTIATIDGLLEDLEDAKSRRARREPHETPYSGILFCSECGSRMHTKHNHRTMSGKPYHGWTCGKRGDGCAGHGSSERFVDRAVSRALKKLFAIHLEGITASDTETSQVGETVEQTMGRLEKMIQRAYDLFCREKITEEQLDELVDGYKRQLSILQPPQPKVSIPKEKIAEFYRLVDEQWDNLPPVVKKEILTAIRARIVVRTDGKPLWIRMTVDSGLSENPIQIRLDNHNHKYRVERRKAKAA